MKMRVPIREQLAFLVILCSLLGLAVISVAVWINNHNFVTSVTGQELALTASLKAGQIAADLVLLTSLCETIVTRVLIQQAILDFYAGNTSTDNWVPAINDLQHALATAGTSNSLLQVKLFSRNSTGNAGGLVNVTATDAVGIELPNEETGDSPVYLGDEWAGYPSELYPNLTYVQTDEVDPSDPTTNLTLVYAFTDRPLNTTSSLFLGPSIVNSSFALVSITLPVVNNDSSTSLLGFMTVVAEATTLLSVLSSQEGLGTTGTSLIIGPDTPQNRFRSPYHSSNSTYTADKDFLGGASVDFVFPPLSGPDGSNRHKEYSALANDTFLLKNYPAALDAYANINRVSNNASSLLSTHNEANVSVAVGYARPQTTLVTWVLIVEKSHDEAWEPITQLRNILLACVFGTIGFILFLVVPLAHYSVRPIRELRDATEKSIQPPGYTPNGSLRSESLEDRGDEAVATSRRSKKGFWVRLKRLGRRSRASRTRQEYEEEVRRRIFKIPGKVRNRKHFITDELTELTATFNEMSDELTMQYARLEERVIERTRDLEVAKKAAEAANESKTLFIANISHELKTPLNGILGMCAVCMGENDLPKIKRSLQVVYKSGDLLLHLLNDLLTFSKNQIGQQLSLEEKDFRLEDIRSQILTIFDKQVKESEINFAVNFMSADAPDVDESSISEDVKGLPALGPQGTGRLKDMTLWGDQHRILQVIINLVSNSLKFTPQGGRVEVRIKCIGELERGADGSATNSLFSKQGSQRQGRTRYRVGSGSTSSGGSRIAPSSSSKPVGTAVFINPMDRKTPAQTQIRERTPTPPPANARTLLFEFEVQDTGPGIPETLQEKVFEPFVQGDLGLSKKYGGTGLGLSICSQLASLMGGSIGLDSTIGVGTTFRMVIPLKFLRERASSQTTDSLPGSVGGSRPASIHGNDEKAALAAYEASASNGASYNSQFRSELPRLVGLSQPYFPAQSRSANGPSSEAAMLEIERLPSNLDESKLRVLVAEDNPVNQEVVLRMLKLEDISDVVVAKDGQEAYDMVKASMDKGTSFNLIFMDIQMPNLDGLQSTRKIREMGYSNPIVALTAFAEESNVKECMNSGMDMFLSKPIRRPALKQVLKKFATIPEEDNETMSLKKKKTTEQKTDSEETINEKSKEG